tara:strand:+ start:1418 stop:2446 length:1029 start_codon:yes stop_codon:yes gene_type:complete
MVNQLVKTDQVELLPDEVRKFIDPQGQGTDQEHQFFLELCKARNLNPFVKDVYFIKYGSMQAATVIAVDTFVARSMDHSIYEGYEAGWIVGPEDTPTRTHDPFGYLMGAWCKVMRTGMVPCEAVVRFDAFSTEKNRWKIDPFGMIQKCAIAAAHRKAFPKTFAHLYSHEEINNPNEKDEKKKTRKSKRKKGLEGLQDKIDEQLEEVKETKEVNSETSTDVETFVPLTYTEETSEDVGETKDIDSQTLHSNKLLQDSIDTLNSILNIQEQDMFKYHSISSEEQKEWVRVRDALYSAWAVEVNSMNPLWEEELIPDDYNQAKEYCVEIQKIFRPRVPLEEENGS